MRIAINAASLQVLNEQTGYGPELLNRLVNALPNEQFIWIDNAGWQLPFLLKKQKAERYIGLNAEGSATSAVPQVLITEEIMPAGSFVNKALFASTLRKAAALISPSQYHKEQLVAQYKLSDSDVHVIPPVPPRQEQYDYTWEQREAIKEQYAGGNEYFLFEGPLQLSNNIGSLLRAFSVFKKWQKSSMKLLLAGPLPLKHEKELDQLASYRFRSDLVMMNLPAGELAKLRACAYATVYPATYSYSGKTVLEAMAAGVPVITSPGSALEEIGGAAALYADPLNSREWGEQMIRLYKDEALRSRLIKSGKERAEALQQQPGIALLEAILRSAAAV